MFTVDMESRRGSSPGFSHLDPLPADQRSRWRGLQKMLEVIEEKEYRRARWVLEMLFQQFERRLPSGFAKAERLNDHGKKKARIVDGGERDEMSSSRETIGHGGGDFDAKPRLADSARAGNGDQANVGAQEEFLRGVNFFFAADESGALHGNIRLAGFRMAQSFFREAVADSGKLVGEIAR